MADYRRAAYLALLLLPKVPLMVRVVVLHVLRLSEAARYTDLRTELTVAVLRALMAPSRPRSISAVQRMSTHDAGVKGRVWVSRYAAAPPEGEDERAAVRDAVFEAIHAISDPTLPKPDLSSSSPDLVAVEAEWTGYRAGVADDQELPPVGERDRFAQMMDEVSHPTTVLYLHGGAFYMCDPASHRATTTKLARLTGGRCYSVRYRLAPQHPFPAALLDALVSYLALLYPPPDAYHEAVRPEHLVIAGDSAGGNLALGLLQLLMQLRRTSTPVTWYGQPRHLPLPASVACNSPWMDITQSWSTWDAGAPAHFDYLPKPRRTTNTTTTTTTNASPTTCALWPARPPRRHLYAADDLAAHPLAALVLCGGDAWRGAPPVYMCVGWEILAPEVKFVAGGMARAGVPLVLEEYEAMPHTFALLLAGAPATRRCFDGWARFIRASVDDPASIASNAVTVKALTLEEVPLRFEDLTDLTDEDVRRRLYVKEGLVSATQISAKL